MTIDEHRARDRRPVGPLQRRGPVQPPGRLRQPPLGRTTSPPRARQPTAGLPLQQVARQPVDGRPGGGPAAVLRSRRPAGTGSRPTGGSSRWSASTPSHSVSLSRRRHLHRWPAMARARPGGGRRGSAGRWARPRCIELYSLLPVRRTGPAARARPRPRRARPRVTGGMAFAGGPFNNFVYQSTAAVVAAAAGHRTALGRGDHGVRPADQARVWRCGRPSPTAARPCSTTSAAEAAAATPTVDGGRRPTTARPRRLLHRDLRRRQGAGPGGRVGRRRRGHPLRGRRRGPGLAAAARRRVSARPSSRCTVQRRRPSPSSRARAPALTAAAPG